MRLIKEPNKLKKVIEPTPMSQQKSMIYLQPYFKN